MGCHQVRFRGPGYRPEIDGLRAIAIVPVVLFHLDLYGFGGGFVGVDVFFVISGYLITTMVQREVMDGTFSFAAFYERRIRRLFPALFVVLTATILASMVWQLPSDALNTAKGSMATVLYAFNVLQWKSSGYFAAASDLNPLLHMWSLAVEEQFYIVLPPLLLLVHRFAKDRLRLLLVIGTVASLVLCVVYQQRNPDAAFYLTPFRAWELMAGAIVGLGYVAPIRNPRMNQVAAVVGLTMIVGAVASFTSRTPFPGWATVLPVIGTSLVLLTLDGAPTAVGRALSTRLFVAIGLVSYSLYIWHWPVIVFTEYLTGDWWGVGGRVVAVIVTVVAATASYLAIERPLRRVDARIPRIRVFSAAAGASIVIVAASATILQMRGVPQRWPEAIVALDSSRVPEVPFKACASPTISDVESGTVCQIGATGTTIPRLLLWGDSHLLAWAPSLDQVLRDAHLSALIVMQPACPPLLGVANRTIPSSCPEKAAAVLRLLTLRPELDGVLIAASWQSYANHGEMYEISDGEAHAGNAAIVERGIRRTASAISGLQRHLVVLGPVPRPPGDVPQLMAFAAARSEPPPVPESRDAQVARAAAFWAAIAAARQDQRFDTIDPLDWFCGREVCDYQRDGIPLYRDSGHLSIAGAVGTEDRMKASLAAAQLIEMR